MSSPALFSMQLDLQEASAGPQETVNEYLTSCKDGETKKVLQLLKANQTLRLQSKKDKNGQTGLMLTAGNGHSDTLKEMLPLHMKAERQMQDAIKNQTAREWAEYHDREDCVNLLEENR